MRTLVGQLVPQLLDQLGLRLELGQKPRREGMEFVIDICARRIVGRQRMVKQKRLAKLRFFAKTGAVASVRRMAQNQTKDSCKINPTG